MLCLVAHASRQRLSAFGRIPLESILQERAHASCLGAAGTVEVAVGGSSGMAPASRSTRAKVE